MYAVVSSKLSRKMGYIKNCFPIPWYWAPWPVKTKPILGGWRVLMGLDRDLSLDRVSSSSGVELAKT